MYRKEVNARSPVRLLERSIHGGLGPGNLGVVLARAGVGKTAFLVQLALDDLLRERKVLHVSLDLSIERVQHWYDELFADLEQHTSLDDPVAARILVERNRMIQVYGDHSFSPSRLGSVLEILREHADFVPAAILVDGADWSRATYEEVAALKVVATEAGAELWLSVLTHRHESRKEPAILPPPCDRFDDLIDVAVHLQPHGKRVDLRLLRDHDAAEVKATTLELEPLTLRLSDTSAALVAVAAEEKPEGYTLYSGGAEGAEAAFGELAERYGLKEVNFSFASHRPVRQRGLVELSERELRRGDVSLSYVTRRMSRSFSDSNSLRRVLQTIWHQIHSSQQVLVVGVIQEDSTVRGGTGWGAELARVWGKSLYVFDQEQLGWFHWDGAAREWTACAPPRVEVGSFCGTGTRVLSDAGRRAIEDVFERTFGTI